MTESAGVRSQSMHMYDNFEESRGENIQTSQQIQAVSAQACKASLTKR